MKRVCCDGYEEKDDTKCTPVCHYECPENSHCSSPDTCICKEGYEDLGEGCKPICHNECPENSYCSGPDTCICKEEYEDLGEGCKPICNKVSCEKNAFCAAPNICHCVAGFTIDYEISQKCVPICAGLPENSECLAPDEWRCKEGYKKFENGICKPICDPACGAQAYCHSPNICQCSDGYERNTVTDLCEPVCSTECELPLKCVAPGNCGCGELYEFINITGIQPHCAPICEQNCSKYGTCIAPNTCECLSGYEKQMLDLEKPLCQPICSPGCDEYGFCFAPDKCVCDAGYKIGPNKTCQANCSWSCEFSDCVEPEICSCWPGYRLKEKSVNVCEPICTQTCVNATCAAPETCECWENHSTESGETISKNSIICLPIHTNETISLTTINYYDKETTTEVAPTTDSNILHCTKTCMCWINHISQDRICLNICQNTTESRNNNSCLELNNCICDNEDDSLSCETDGNTTHYYCLQENILVSSDAIFSESPSANYFVKGNIYMLTVIFVLYKFISQ